MSVDDFCRFCKEHLRIKGNLANTKKIFDTKKVPNEKNVNERLIELGLTLSRENSRSSRICRSCLRLLGRIETDFAIFRRWQEGENEPSPAVSTSTVQTACTQDSEPKPTKIPMSIIEVGPEPTRPMSIIEIEVCPEPPIPTRTPTRKYLPRPNAEVALPTRQSQTEVIIRYPSHPKGDKIICKANSAGLVENIAKENWRTAANLIVRNKDLFGQLKHNILQVIEDESKILCNPYKGFMLWRSTADDLKSFSFANLQSDLQRMSPFIFSIFSRITKQSPYSTCSAAAIALKGREPRLSAFAYYVDSVLQYGGARKAVFNRLSKLGITTSHPCAVRKRRELASAYGEDFQLLTVGNETFLESHIEDGEGEIFLNDSQMEDGDSEIFLDPQVEDGDTDNAEGGSVVQGVEDTNLMCQMALHAPAMEAAELDILIVDSDEEGPSSSSTEVATQIASDHKRKPQDIETGEASAKRQRADPSTATADTDAVISLAV